MIFTYTLGSLLTNCYLIVQNGKAVLIDAPDGAGDFILRKLRAHGCTLAAILLTHAHYDHIASADIIREATGAPLYIGKGDAEALSDARLSYSLAIGGVDRGIRPADVILENGDKLNLNGAELLALETPGHSRGSITYVTDGAMFTGDLLFRGTIGRTDFYGGDYDTLISSLISLSAFSAGREYKVYPGHGEGTSLNYEIKYNPYYK